MERAKPPGAVSILQASLASELHLDASSFVQLQEDLVVDRQEGHPVGGHGEELPAPDALEGLLLHNETAGQAQESVYSLTEWVS